MREKAFFRYRDTKKKNDYYSTYLDRVSIQERGEGDNYDIVGFSIRSNSVADRSSLECDVARFIKSDSSLFSFFEKANSQYRCSKREDTWEEIAVETSNCWDPVV